MGRPEALRTVTRGHIIAWRKELELNELAPSSIRRKLSAVSSLFDYLCERNAVVGNPVDGVKRPAANGNEGSTLALGEAQARQLLEAPPEETLKGLRDRAILATLLYHGIRRKELCLLRPKDLQSREGVIHFRIQGQARQDPLCARASAGPAVDPGVPGRGRATRPTSVGRCSGPCATTGPIKGSTGRLTRARSTATSFAITVHDRHQRRSQWPCLHSLRATAATNALQHQADMGKVQEWLGHANVSTTRFYDRRKTRPEESPTFKVSY